MLSERLVEIQNRGGSIRSLFLEFRATPTTVDERAVGALRAEFSANGILVGPETRGHQLIDEGNLLRRTRIGSRKTHAPQGSAICIVVK